ncbi:MAG: SDR family NAD(P)-dependent oxidoreductase [Acidimicrobiales bacterium]
MPIAIVTGASKGFGRALALDLAADGWDLVIDARHASELALVAEEIAERGARVTAVAGDVTDPAHRAALVAAAGQYGALHLLVSNASALGPSPRPELADYPLDELRRVLEVNVLAPLALAQAALEALRASRGVVVAISSDAAVEPYAGWGGYGSSKAALDHLHRVLGVEEPDLRVYAFDPGDMRTDMHQAAFPGEDISDRATPESVVPALRALVESGRPSGRYAAGDVVSA